MGRFVNPGNSAFQAALNSQIYVDKTGLLEYTNRVLNTKQAWICSSRLRRFGKSRKKSILPHLRLIQGIFFLWGSVTIKRAKSISV